MIRMLFTLATLLFAQAGPMAPRLPEAVELQVGERRVFHLPNVQSISVSSVAVYSVQILEGGDIALEGFEPGRTTVIFRLSDGNSVTLSLSVVPRHELPPSVPVKGKTLRGERVSPDGGVDRGRVQVFELPDDIHDVHTVAEADGGLVLEGVGGDGVTRIITVSPRP